jgi:hypothetical protein
MEPKANPKRLNSMVRSPLRINWTWKNPACGWLRWLEFIVINGPRDPHFIKE